MRCNSEGQGEVGIYFELTFLTVAEFLDGRQLSITYTYIPVQ